MTPKERLKRLESYSVCDNYREKEEDFKEIEKALEVLDILKKRIYIMSQAKDSVGTVLAETIGFLLNSVDEDYIKVKEWLGNE